MAQYYLWCIFTPLGVFFMKTLQDQWYAVTKVYSEALPSQVFQVVAKSNQELGFRPDHKGHIRHMVARVLTRIMQ